MTGGASAVYGSDAIAGVVNFIMRKDFEGVEFDGTWSEAQHDQHNGVIEAATHAAHTGIPINLPTGSIWDGRDVDATFVMGVNSPNGKGNVTAYAGYRNVTTVTQDKRDFSDCVTLANFYTTPNPFGNFYCGGSSTNPGGRFIPLSGPHAGSTPGSDRRTARSRRSPSASSASTSRRTTSCSVRTNVTPAA